MKTDELIDSLSSHVEPVKATQLCKILMMSLAAGVGVTVCLMLTVFGIPGLRVRHGRAPPPSRGPGVQFELDGNRCALSGERRTTGRTGRKPLVLIGLVFLTLLCAGLIALAFAPLAAWRGMLLSPQLVDVLALHSNLRSRAVHSTHLGLASCGPYSSRIDRSNGGTDCRGIERGNLLVLYPWQFAPHSSRSGMGGIVLLCALVGATVGPLLLKW